MRLQKYLANAGVASRRACEKLIENGEITINGNVAVIGDKVEDGDVVEYNGKVIDLPLEYIYLMLFKPVGVITTASDERGRKTVLDLIDIDERIYPVGRLDLNTSGLLLLTNDGELANRLTHPRFQVDKTYKAIVKGEITEDKLQQLRDGVMLEDGMTAPAKARVSKYDGENSYVEITIHEGKNRQVRRMFEAVGHQVRGLRRVKVGNLSIKDMERGQYRHLTQEEVSYLKNLTAD